MAEDYSIHDEKQDSPSGYSQGARTSDAVYGRRQAQAESAAARSTDFPMPQTKD